MRISDWSSDVCSSDLSNLFGSDDGALNSAGGSAVGNEAWQVMMGGDANRSQVDPAWLEDIRQKGQEINENAGSSGLGENISNTPGTCEEVKVGETQDYYDATCEDRKRKRLNSTQSCE